MALAQPEDFESQSHEKPGQSRGIQAKLGRNITNSGVDKWEDGALTNWGDQLIDHRGDPLADWGDPLANQGDPKGQGPGQGVKIGRAHV